MPEQERKISPAVAIIPIGLGLAAVVGIAAMAWAAPPTPPPGRANLYGKVTDAVTGSPISGVLVSLNGYSTYTDNAGNYIFPDLEPGSYVAQFSKYGYLTEVF